MEDHLKIDLKLRRWRKQIEAKNGSEYQIDRALAQLEWAIDHDYELRAVVNAVTAQLRSYRRIVSTSD